MTMTLRSDTGRIGEDVACEFLKENGFRILFRNARNKFGELDIVAKDKDGTLAFVEVKTIRQYGNLETFAEFMPEDQMSNSKLRKLKRIAEFFANEHPNLVDDEKGWRLDCTAIMLDTNEDSPSITHYKNI